MTFTYIILHFNVSYFDFYNSEVLTSLPHNLVLDPQPRFGLTQSDFLKLYNFLITKRIFIKFIAKCKSLQLPSSEFKDNLCNPIPLTLCLPVLSAGNLNANSLDPDQA